MNKKPLTTWQATMLMCVCLISTKFQRLPALLAEDFSRDGWLLILIYLFIDIIFLLLMVNVICRCKDKTFFEIVTEKYGKVFMTIIALAISLYYLFKIAIAYKGVHEFFANTLFDKLSWSYFSILLLILLLFMTTSGLNILGRSSELYAGLIGLGIAFVLILGLKATRFERLLPILDRNIGETALKSVNYFSWFGDYFALVFLIGNIKFDKPPKRCLVGSYFISGIIVVLIFAIFYAVNDNLSVFQSNTLSSITQYSLIGLGIGRPDWFLVLFVMISTIISSAFFAYAMIYSFTKAIHVKFNYIAVFIGMIFIYINDIYIFANIEEGIILYKNYFCYYMVTLNILIPILLNICLIKKRKSRQDENIVKQYYKARCEL